MAKLAKQRTDEDLYIVGVGTSAGGIDALSKMLESFAISTKKIAVVIAQHLKPSHKSELAAILARSCRWPVVTIKGETKVEAGNVYVTPQNKKITYSRQRLQLEDLPPKYSYAPNIDDFFTSLAENKQQHAIGVILSGTAQDGTEGIKLIKQFGGFTIAQTPESAQYQEMPLMAIQSGNIDIICHPSKVFDEIISYIKNHNVVKTATPNVKGTEIIFEMLSKRTGIDFSQYKQNTIMRRIDKRIEALRLSNVTEYTRAIKQSPSELDNLFETVLIGVTEFFRDKEAFNSLEKELKKILEKKHESETIRIWSVGCATGEEAYTLAILLREMLGPRIARMQVQIFASDIDERALNFARKGIYSEKSIESLEPGLAEKYFDKKEYGYEAMKILKQHILFSQHDITNDPPFVKLDLIVCRNLLIYFNNYLQKEALRTFNYSLNSDGLLFLGKSESVSVAGDLFNKLADEKIYRKIQPDAPFNLRFSRHKLKSNDNQEQSRQNKNMSLVDAAKDTLYHSGEHPFVIINDLGDIKETQGSLRLYLELSQGAINTNVFKMANKELVIEIRTLLAQVKKSNAIEHSAVIKFSLFDKEHFVRLKIIPLMYLSGGTQLYILMFEQIEPNASYLQFTKELNSKDFEDLHVKQLEQEVSSLREHLQIFTEELEINNEEMQAINEELQSANEELKSSNEELETSNEELQSSNEELHTANTELRFANTQLIQKEDELKKATQKSKTNEILYRTISENIPNGTVGILNDQFIVEYVAGKGLEELNIKASDVIGKSLPDMNSSEIERKKLIDAFSKTLRGEPCELEFGFNEHRYYLQTIPLNTDSSAETKIMYLTQDISERKHKEELLQQSEANFRTLAENIPNLCWTANADGWIYWYNSRWYEYTGTTPKDMEGWGWQSVHDQEMLPEVLEKWRKSIADGESFEMTFPLRRYDGEFHPFLTRIFPFKNDEGEVIQWFGTNTDITHQMEVAEKLEAMVDERTNELSTLNDLLEKKNQELKKSNEDLQQFAHVASHDLKEPIRKIKTFNNILLTEYSKVLDNKARLYLQKIGKSTDRMFSMIDGVLSYSMLDSYTVLSESVDLNEIIKSVQSELELFIEEKEAKVTYNQLPVIEGSEFLLFQVFYNLVKNALKFSKKEELPIIKIIATAVTQDQQAYTQIEVSDNGIGFKPEFAETIFKTFSRLHSNDHYEGSGLGLALVRKIVQRHGGKISAIGDPGKGSIFTILLPCKQSNS